MGNTPNKERGAPRMDVPIRPPPPPPAMDADLADILGTFASVTASIRAQHPNPVAWMKIQNSVDRLTRMTRR